MIHMNLDLVEAIQEDRLEDARRGRLGSAARQSRRDAREDFSLQGALGIRAKTKPACGTCPVPAG